MSAFKEQYCRGCRKFHDIGRFSPRRDNPTKFYDYCDTARTKGVFIPKAAYKNEIDELRKQSKRNRVLDITKATEISARAKAGEKYSDLAEAYGVSLSTIGKAARHPEKYA